MQTAPRSGPLKLATFHLRAVALDVAAAERGVGADAADHDVNEPAAIACEFVGLDARNVRAMEMARMCMHVRKHPCR